MTNYVDRLTDVQASRVNALFFRGPGGATAFRRGTKRAGGNILPDVHSLDPVYRQKAFQLARRLGEVFPVQASSNPTWAGPNATPRDFSGLVTVMPGYPMTPTSVPVPSTAPARLDAGLPADPDLSPAHERIFTWVFELMFEDVDHSRSLKLRKEASSMAPFYTSQPDKKVEMYTGAMKSVDQILKLHREDDLEALQRKFAGTASGDKVFRDQADSATLGQKKIEKTKVREVNDEEYARSFGSRGSRSPADKTVTVDGNQLDFAQAARRRDAWGMSGIPNFIASALFTALRNYNDRFGFTYKHTSSEQKLEKMKRFRYHLGIDVHQHDQMIAGRVMKLWKRLLRRRFREDVADYIGDLFTAPVFCRNPDGTPGGFWIGNPLEPDRSFNWGLLSGVGPNPDFGKWNMTGSVLCSLHDIGCRFLQKEEVRKFLQGDDRRAGMLNCVDDNVIGFNDFHLWKAFSRGLEKGNLSPYHKFDPENPIVFLGDVFYIDAAGRMCVAPSIVSYFQNFLCPEYTIESRPYWTVGYFAREAHYSRMPKYGEAHELMNEYLSPLLGMSLDQYVAEHRADALASVLPGSQRQAILQRLMSGYVSDADAAYLMNPAAIYYKLDPAELSPALQEAAMTTISGEEMGRALGHLYTTSVH